MRNDTKDTVAVWLLVGFFGVYFLEEFTKAGEFLSVGKHLHAALLAAWALVVGALGALLFNHLVNTMEERKYYQRLYEESRGQICHYHPCDHFLKWEEKRKEQLTEAKCETP